MINLSEIIYNENFHQFLYYSKYLNLLYYIKILLIYLYLINYIDQKLKPIMCLLVDEGSDENSRFLKNIINYCKFFIYYNLDYLTIRTHAPDQSAYNSIEKSMCTLFEKLVGIVL